MPLWPKEIEGQIEKMIIPMALHVCSGTSRLGELTIDLYEESADLKWDVLHLRDLYSPDAYETVLCDPPHDMKAEWYTKLFSELGRVARDRIIFQHWFIPSNQDGSFKGDKDFKLTHVLTWHPKPETAVTISVFDK